MDRILFGDNQFFGINHASEEKSRSALIRFKDDKTILNTIKDAFEEEVFTFMCTTHDRMININSLIRQDEKLSDSLKVYPCLPYAHKYANAMTELGLTGILKSYVPGNYLGTFLKGGMALASNNMLTIMEILIDAEMKMFKGMNVPVVFLQNIVTDILIGLRMYDIIHAFHNYIIKKYNAEPGYITMNLPLLSKVFEQLGIKDAIICTSLNVDGFRMSGGKNAYEKIISEKKHRLIAMQVFSGGASNPQKSLEYVCSLRGVHSILFGASTKCNIHDTVSMIRQKDSKVNSII